MPAVFGLLCSRCLRQNGLSVAFRGYRSSPRSTRTSARRLLQTETFQPFVPPPPDSLPPPSPPKTYPRVRRYGRRILYLLAGIGIIYGFDRTFLASSLTRCARTFGLGIIVALDYKINFRPHPPLAESIPALHARNAERLFNLLRANGGLYLKIGQAIAMQSAVLPPEFQKMFAKMFDDAPQNGWKDVLQVIKEDFGGRSPEEVFGVSFDGHDPTKGLMERTARASASVAQVHWARLPDGREVAVKIQKREIARQVGWDLWAFKYQAPTPSPGPEAFGGATSIADTGAESSCTFIPPYSIFPCTALYHIFRNDSIWRQIFRTKRIMPNEWPSL